MTGPSSAAGRYSSRPVGLQGSSSSQPVLQTPQADKSIPDSGGISWLEQLLGLKGTMQGPAACVRGRTRAGTAGQASKEAGVTCRNSSGPSQPS